VSGPVVHLQDVGGSSEGYFKPIPAPGKCLVETVDMMAEAAVAAWNGLPREHSPTDLM